MEVLNLEKWESFPWWLRLLQLLKSLVAGGKSLYHILSRGDHNAGVSKLNRCKMQLREFYLEESKDSEFSLTAQIFHI